MPHAVDKVPAVAVDRNAGMADPVVVTVVFTDLVASTAALAINAEDVEVVPIGVRQLKGLAEPTPVVAVVAAPVDEGPAPNLGLATKQDLSFVGRAAEFERFTNAWQAVLRTGLRVVALAGEPGAGKTRLALELARFARSEGARVAAGSCDDGPQPPFQPVAMALATLVEELGTRLLEESGVDGTVLSALVPAVGQPTPLPLPGTGSSDADRLRLFDAVAAVVRAAAQPAGLVLLLDDAQWADVSSTQLLRHVLRCCREYPVVVLTTYRDTDISGRSPFAGFLSEAARRGVLDTIPVAGLDAADVRTLVGRICRLDPAAALETAANIHASTAGNAFFVEELCREAASRVELALAGDGTPASTSLAPVPSSVRTLVRMRIERLSTPARDLLSVGAVLGREFALELAERVGSPPDPLDELVAARLLLDRGNGRAASFVHDIVREAVHAELPPARRRRLHRDAATALAASAAPAAEVARHLVAAGALAGDAELLEWTARAADEAVALLAFEQAVLHAEQALEVAVRVGPTAALDALIALGEALYRAGDVALGQKRFLEAAEQARATGDVRRLGRVALAISGFNTGLVLHALAQADPRAAELLKEAAEAIAPLDVLEDEDITLRTVLASAAITFSNQPGGARAVEALIRSAHRRRDWRGMTWALLVRPGYRLSATPTDEHVSMLDDLIAGAHKQRLRDVELLARSIRVDALLLRGEGDALDEELQAHRLLAGESRAVHHEVTALALGAMRLIQLGQLDDAAATAQRMFEIGSEVGYGAALAIYGAQTVGIAYERTGAVELRGLMEATLRTLDIPEWKAMLSQASAVAGDRQRALDLVAELAPRGFACLERSTMLVGPAVLADTCWELRCPDYVDELLHHLEPASGWHAAIGTGVLYVGPVDRAIGRLLALKGDLDGADSAFDRAIEQARRAGAPTWLAKAQHQRAEVLLLRQAPGDAERAADLLQRAGAAADRHGLTLLARRVAETSEASRS